MSHTKPRIRDSETEPASVRGHTLTTADNDHTWSGFSLVGVNACLNQRLKWRKNGSIARDDVLIVTQPNLEMLT